MIPPSTIISVQWHLPSNPPVSNSGMIFAAREHNLRRMTYSKMSSIQAGILNAARVHSGRLQKVTVDVSYKPRIEDVSHLAADFSNKSPSTFVHVTERWAAFRTCFCCLDPVDPINSRWFGFPSEIRIVDLLARVSRPHFSSKGRIFVKRKATNVSCDHSGFGFYKDADLYIVVIWPAAGGTPTAVTAKAMVPLRVIHVLLTTVFCMDKPLAHWVILFPIKRYFKWNQLFLTSGPGSWHL